MQGSRAGRGRVGRNGQAVLDLHLNIELLSGLSLDLEQAAPGGELMGRRCGGDLRGDIVEAAWCPCGPAPHHAAPAVGGDGLRRLLDGRDIAASLTLSATSLLPLPSAWLNFMP